MLRYRDATSLSCARNVITQLDLRQSSLEIWSLVLFSPRKFHLDSKKLRSANQSVNSKSKNCSNGNQRTAKSGQMSCVRLKSSQICWIPTNFVRDSSHYRAPSNTRGVRWHEKFSWFYERQMLDRNSKLSSLSVGFKNLRKLLQRERDFKIQ